LKREGKVKTIILLKKTLSYKQLETNDFNSFNNNKKLNMLNE